jgi:hypothetical protein
MWLLLGRIYIPESFHGHFHAYIAKALDKCHALIPGDELDHHALDGYTVGDDLYVSLHHKVHRRAQSSSSVAIIQELLFVTWCAGV